MKIRFSLLLILLFGIINVEAQQINKTDNQGKRHGLWKGIYEDTKLPRYEGTFNHGKETGVFKFFNNDSVSSLMATRDFSLKDGSYYVVFYGEKGKKASEGKEVNKQRVGEWKFYHPGKETIMLTEHYTKGQLTGVRKVYFANGKIAEEAQYANGVRNGVYKKYTEKGLQLEESHYKDGKLHGHAIFKDSHGQVVAEGDYSNGARVGQWKFYENGKLVKQEDKGEAGQRK
ncbi:toxin-antitoxin system YwqK family antitoxin [Flavobacterium sp. MK4S-17]|uniref:toxin-antitoxin system YwqK family antitoxin n=1 Tax=Flavobacterium sp. MK4S-17 TaxID=2543737 RepID=UPI00135BB720|nr:hypothetical protein [Flavobacterium sp. MK4S-17]